MDERRDTRIDPQPGDTMYVNRFAGGTTFRVVKRMLRKGWGDSVQVELHSHAGQKLKPLRRIYSMASWSALFDPDPQPDGQEG